MPQSKFLQCIVLMRILRKRLAGKYISINTSGSVNITKNRWNMHFLNRPTACFVHRKICLFWPKNQWNSNKKISYLRIWLAGDVTNNKMHWINKWWCNLQFCLNSLTGQAVSFSSSHPWLLIAWFVQETKPSKEYFEDERNVVWPTDCYRSIIMGFGLHNVPVWKLLFFAKMKL